MVDFSNREEGEAWFEARSRETALAVTLRYAIRTVPLLDRSAHPSDNWSDATFSDFCLDTFRSLIIAYVAAKYPKEEETLRLYVSYAFSRILEVPFSQVAPIQYVISRASSNTARSLQPVFFAMLVHERKPYTVAFSLSALNLDVERIEEGMAPEMLAQTMIWPYEGNHNPTVLINGMPGEVAALWRSLKSSLLAQNQDWDVWTRWYEARVKGEPSNRDLDLAIATIPNEDWEQGPAHVNKLIKALEDKFAPRAAPTIKPVTLQELASIASPTIVLTASGQIDAIPNPKFDLPIVEPDKLLSASNSLRKIIDITLAALPQNAPPALRRSFEIYNQELTDNPAIPILGDIVDFHDIIYAGWNEANAEQEWLTLSLDLSFKKFFARHIAFLAMFSSNDEKREILGRLSLDHAKVDLEASNKRLRVLDEAVLTLRPQKIFTSRFETELKNLRLEGEQLQAGQTIHPSEESTSLVKSFAAKSYGIFHAAGEECKRALALGGVLSAGYAALDFNGAKHLMLSWLLNVTK